MRKLTVLKFWIPALIFSAVLLGCGDPDKNSHASNPGDQLTPPTVTVVTPLAGSVGVCPNTTPLVVSAVFSKPMNPSTIVAPGTFTLSGPGSTAVAGTVSYVVSTNTATFTPTAALGANILYTATISSAATDLFGNMLTPPKTWTFMTSPVCGPAPPGLGTACGVGILAGSTVTNVTGTATSVSGDVDVSPGTAITGFGTPASITGAFHSADGVAAQAQSDLTKAYNTAAGTAATANLTGTDLGTIAPLGPGVYKFNSSAQLTGTLHLTGSATDVWIFQVGTALTTASNSQVILSGGALSKNVFWQVGSSATLGTGSTMTGIIMANQSISLNTGATLNGRALASIGAVTLDTNTVNVPPCP
jgi:hypothetical protein